MEKRKVSPLIALIPVLFLIASLYYAIQIVEASPHIPLFTSAIFAALIGMFVLKIKWSEIEEGIVDTIKMSMGAILILMIIGMVIGTWILSGVVPTMIHYGLLVLSPKIFLFFRMTLPLDLRLSLRGRWKFLILIIPRSI